MESQPVSIIVTVVENMDCLLLTAAIHTATEWRDMALYGCVYVFASSHAHVPPLPIWDL